MLAKKVENMFNHTKNHNRLTFCVSRMLMCVSEDFCPLQPSLSIVVTGFYFLH